MFTFEWDRRDLEVWYGNAVGTAIHRALRMAGNRAIRGLQSDAVKHVQRAKQLSLVDITRDQELRMPSRRAALRDLAWVLWVKGRPVPVSKFPHIDTRRLRTRRGVLVRFGPQGTQRLSSAFVSTMKSGHMGVFKRTGDGRLPIEEVFSSRLPARFGQDVLLSYGDKSFRKMGETFTKGLARELAKLKRKGQA